MANHIHAIAIYFMHYNLVRQHQSLRVSPAMGPLAFPTALEHGGMVKIVKEWEAGGNDG